MIPVATISFFKISPQNRAFSHGMMLTLLAFSANLCFNPFARFPAILGKLSANTAVVIRSAFATASTTSEGCVTGDKAETFLISFLLYPSSMI